jgi:RNA polymerase primary sigma factor
MGRTGRRVLTTAEQGRLCRRIQRGDLRAKDEMIEAHLGLVHAVAGRYRGSGVAHEDLVQEGTIGLVRAVEKFDPDRGLKFSTYAVWWIWKALIAAVAESRTIRIPPGAGRAIAALQRAESDLRRDPHAVPTLETLADRTGLSVGRVQALRSAARVTVSLDAAIREDGASMIEFVPDPSSVDPSRLMQRRETEQEIGSMVAVLPRRHREVVSRRYGLHGRPQQSHAEIGQSLGVGEERSRQLEREALHRLRQFGAERFRAA